MDERQIDFKKHAPKKGKPGYLIRILVYVLVLGIIGFYLRTKLNEKQNTEEIKEINKVKIEMD